MAGPLEGSRRWHGPCGINPANTIIASSLVTFGSGDARGRNSQNSNTVHFRYSGHLGPPLSGHYIRLATISDLNIIE